MEIQPNGKVRVYDPNAYGGTGAYQEKWPVDAQEQLARCVVFATKKESDRAAAEVKAGKTPTPSAITPKPKKKKNEPESKTDAKSESGDSSDYGDWKIKALKAEVEGRKLKVPDPATKEDLIALLVEDDEDE